VKKIRGDEYVKVYQIKGYEDKNPGKLEAIGVSGYFLDRDGQSLKREQIIMQSKT
jgi:hypothetical protein